MHEHFLSSPFVSADNKHKSNRSVSRFRVGVSARNVVPKENSKVQQQFPLKDFGPLAVLTFGS